MDYILATSYKEKSFVKNTGKEYEEFVQTLYQAILKSEELGLGNQQNIKVEINKLLRDINGIERQFDIYWEYRLGGITYKTIIECKDYNSKVSMEKIDALDGKLDDFPNLRGIFATKKGYQSGAEQKAKCKNIELLIIREQNDSDWKDKDGTPLLKGVNLNVTAIHSATITDFIPLVSEYTHPISISALNNEILITHDDTNETYSLYELQRTLMKGHTEEEGKFQKEEKFKGKVSTPTHEFPIEGYRIEYSLVKPTTTSISLDFSEKLLGVVEYLNQGFKAKVFDDHIKVE